MRPTPPWPPCQPDALTCLADLSSRSADGLPRGVSSTCTTADIGRPRQVSNARSPGSTLSQAPTWGLTPLDADGLYLSLNTIKTYIRTAYPKFVVTTRVQAVLWVLGNWPPPTSSREPPSPWTSSTGPLGPTASRRTASAVT